LVPKGRGFEFRVQDCYQEQGSPHVECYDYPCPHGSVVRKLQEGDIHQKPGSFVVTVVDDGQTRLTARAPLVLTAERLGDRYELSYPSLGLLGRSHESFEAAETRVASSLAWFWRMYVLTADSKLTPAALRLKRTLLDLFEENPT
jgi:hypothetical protein